MSEIGQGFLCDDICSNLHHKSYFCALGTTFQKHFYQKFCPFKKSHVGCEEGLIRLPLTSKALTHTCKNTRHLSLCKNSHVGARKNSNTNFTFEEFHVSLSKIRKNQRKTLRAQACPCVCRDEWNLILYWVDLGVYTFWTLFTFLEHLYGMRARTRRRKFKRVVFSEQYKLECNDLQVIVIQEFLLHKDIVK